MLREITAEQFGEWRAFAELEPFGKRAEDIRTGIIAATIGNFSEISKKHDWSPLDFMPGEQEAEDPSKALGKRILAAFQAMGAKEVKPS